MQNLFHDVDWNEKSVKLDELLGQSDLSVHTMNQGNEAEVMKISTEKESFVLKCWTLDSKPNIQFQYHLLNTLSARGLSVSKAIGWGINSEEDSVLLTSYDGTPATHVSKEALTEIASILSSIHKTPLKKIDITLPKYDFISYFYPGIEAFPDLHKTITELVGKTEIRQNCVIHGDFHFENIVEDNGRYTVIDWTNGQLGDKRYDFAWSNTLFKIYSPSDQYSSIFHTAYLLENPLQDDEIELFEALACLRWIYLNRNKNVPIKPDTIKRVKNVICTNPYLMEQEL
ncbi:aminoglycoside phosphotransferase family protein [Virgibacillus necropolis]|uniref:aminoglycoside phosphotransferase family protein n=1 Tax=Virgibacillus necropolis TaxID=163877 RepID=UPI00384D8E70